MNLMDLDGSIAKKVADVSAEDLNIALVKWNSDPCITCKTVQMSKCGNCLQHADYVRIMQKIHNKGLYNIVPTYASMSFHLQKFKLLLRQMQSCAQHIKDSGVPEATLVQALRALDSSLEAKLFLMLVFPNVEFE